MTPSAHPGTGLPGRARSRHRVGPSADRTAGSRHGSPRRPAGPHAWPNPTGRTPAALDARGRRHPRGHGPRRRPRVPRRLHRAAVAAARGDRRGERGRDHARRGRERLGARGRRRDDASSASATRPSTPEAPPRPPTPSTSGSSAARGWSGRAATTPRPAGLGAELPHPQAAHLIWFSPALCPTGRGRACGPWPQYKDYGRWRRVVAHHKGTINARYLAPPTALVAVAMRSLVVWCGGRCRGPSLPRTRQGIGIGEWPSPTTRALAVAVRVPGVLGAITAAGARGLPSPPPPKLYRRRGCVVIERYRGIWARRAILDTLVRRDLRVR